MIRESENLPLQELDECALRAAAEARIFVRPLALYPGHTFSSDWDNPDAAFRGRRAIWEEFTSRRLDASIEFPWYHGLRLLLKMGGDLSRQLFISGCVDPNEIFFLEAFLEPGMVVVDAGANTGIYSLFAAARVAEQGMVLAFEPSSREFAGLSANVAHNHLPNVRLYRIALGAGEGEAGLKIAAGEHEGQNTFGEFVHSGVELAGVERVSVRSLDQVTAEAGLARLDFLKVDIEGGEAALLKGARATLERFRPVLLMELLEPALRKQGSSQEEVLELLEEMNYRLYAFGPSGRPEPAAGYNAGGNIIAAPAEKPLPQAWGAGNAAMKPEAGGGPRPYLSVVVAARNDDHGGNLLNRMQIFVSGWLSQARRYGLNSELIIVEWNPPADRPRLREVLQWPEDTGPCTVRFIEVPLELHRRYEHAEALPLYQMIAKNAGIRRAGGRFILATNIDILFSNELMAFLAERRLDPARMYRIDRHDVMKDVPTEADIDEELEYCRTHLLRLNAKEGTIPLSPDGQRMPAGEDILAADSELRLGCNWFSPEKYADDQLFRWVDNDAEIHTGAPPNRGEVLCLDLEPGPGMGQRAMSLEVAGGGTSETVRVESRGTLKIRFHGERAEGTLCLRVRNGGDAIEQDPRILNFRVFKCYWSETGGNAVGRDGEKRSFELEWARDKRVAWRTWHHFQLLLQRIAEGGPLVTVTLPVSRPLKRAVVFYVEQGGIVGMLRNVGRLCTGGKWVVRKSGPEKPAAEAPVQQTVAFLHTNACGDFTLVARERWFDLRAYPEFDMYSMNIDSVFCYSAHYGGATEELLAEPMRIYHIEHAAGSGWTPEGQKKLYERLAAVGLGFVPYSDVLIWAAQMERLGCTIMFNHEDWGLAAEKLPETVVAGAGRFRGASVMEGVS